MDLSFFFDLIVPLVLIIPVVIFMRLVEYGAKRRRERASLPPGPKCRLLVGNLPNLAAGDGLRHRAMRDLALKHGNLMCLYLGRVPVLVVSSADVALEVMKTQEVAFAGRPRNAIFRSLTVDGNGAGVLASPYGEHWRLLRKICTAELTSARRLRAFRRVREEEVSKLVKYIAGETPPVNVSRSLAALMADIAVREILGRRPVDRAALWHHVGAAAEAAAWFSLADLYPSSRVAWKLSRRRKTLSSHVLALHQLLEPVLDNHQPIAVGAGEEEDEGLVDVLVRLRKDKSAQNKLTKQTISAIIIDLLMFGAEPVAATLQWAMGELLRKPELMHKAQSEVRAAFAGQSEVTEDTLGGLTYLRCVIKETLRLHPPAPLLVPRATQVACQVMGYKVPIGMTVLVNAWAIGRDGQRWADPEEFRPERFEGTDVDFQGVDSELLPFGGGLRVCPGIAAASADIRLILASLLYHFDWKLPDGVKPGDIEVVERIQNGKLKMKSELLLCPVAHVPPSAAARRD